MKKSDWKTYLMIFVGIVMIITIIRIINQPSKSIKNQQTNENTQYSKQSETQYSGENIPERYQQDLGETISNFFDNCLQKNFQNAYEMLSSDVKREMYPTENSFTENYCKARFEGNKEYNFQSWIASGNTYTYKVEIYENMLTTGKANTKYIEDYVTIIPTEDGYKLSINGYIGREQISKQGKNDDIAITATQVDTYMDYQIYSFRIKNNTNEKMKLDEIYITNEKKMNYNAQIYENIEEDLILEPQENQEIKIKFNDQYKTKIEEINFSKIIKENGENQQITIQL